MNNEQIKKTLDSEAGKALKDFIISEIHKANSVNNLKDLDNAEEIAIEVKANKKAVKVLVNIFGQILTWSGEQSKKDERDNYFNL